MNKVERPILDILEKQFYELTGGEESIDVSSLVEGQLMEVHSVNNNDQV
jgi:hypothetical protein